MYIYISTRVYTVSMSVDCVTASTADGRSGLHDRPIGPHGTPNSRYDLDIGIDRDLYIDINPLDNKLC